MGGEKKSNDGFLPSANND